MLDKFPMDPEELAAAIDIPLDDFPGNCHAVADAIRQRLPVAGMRLVRGHFTGHVSRDSLYQRSGMQQHSWLELPDGRILDPTRWAMERPGHPQIYLGISDAYDEGGLASKARIRAATSAYAIFSNSQNTKEDQKFGIIMDALLAMNADDRAVLCAAGAIEESSSYERFAERLSNRFDDPVEHLPDPETFMTLVRGAGLGAMVPIDSQARILAPETVMCNERANRLYELPPAEKLTPFQSLHKVFCHFLSVEAREMTIEDELEEIGYTLDDLHDALNDSERDLSYSPDFVTRSNADSLSVIAGDLLGKGFGAEIEVERFARSVGLDRDAFHLTMKDFGGISGYNLSWLCGQKAKAAENRVQVNAEPDPVEP